MEQNSPELSPLIYSQLIFEKGAKNAQQGKDTESEKGLVPPDKF